MRPVLQHRVAAAVMAAIFLMTGCSADIDATQSDQIGELIVSDGVARITVPALWVGKSADGTPVGGVEPAQIEVSTTGETPEYEVDLADIEARGAGPGWQAATSAAAAFSTLFVGADPAKVDLSFTVTGPIDGPSAGGILAVGIIAAFRGDSLLPNRTMTGTITGDGTIGPVGGITTKITSAARDGYTTVVIPAAMADDWITGNGYTQLATRLGVTVIPVRTIAEAYGAMTGRESPAIDPENVQQMDPNVAAATASSTASVIDALDDDLRSAPADLPDAARLAAARAFGEAREQVRSNDLALAYGTAAFALVRLSRASGAAEVERLLADLPLPSVKTMLARRATAVLARAEQSLRESSAAPVNGLEQSIALPVALAWAAFPEAMMAGLLAELPHARRPATLVEMGRVIAEQEVGLRTLLPAALDIVAASPSRREMDAASVAAHLSAYSRFLVRAAEAGEAYLSDVLGTKLMFDGHFADSGEVAGALAAQAQAIRITPSVQPYADEAQQAAQAMTYFWLVNRAVAGLQAYEQLPELIEGDGEAVTQEAMDTAVDATWWFVEVNAHELAAIDVDASPALWSARWAFEQARANRDSRLSTESAWFAQGELWCDAVQTTMLISAVNPARVHSPG
jgi:hypothetical protein